MNQIKFIPEIDFILYADVITNLEKYRAKYEGELKQKKREMPKALIKGTNEYFDQAKAYLKSLSFIQKNNLKLFFSEIRFTKEYLLHMIHTDHTLDDISSKSLEAYIQKLCETDNLKVPKNFEDYEEFVKAYYDGPEDHVDLDKTTNLIYDFIHTPDLVETSLKPALINLYDDFYERKIKPDLDKIEEIIKKHQVVYDKDPENFLFNLSNGHFDASDIDHIGDMQPIVSYFAPMSLYITIKVKKYIYGQHIDQLESKMQDKDLYEPLLKFLSDTKRYQMVQKLSDKKWYSNELAKEFNITPATMSYHVNKMFGLGLIHFEQGDQNRMYMTLDKDKLKHLLTSMIDDLL
ncbi:winged helix-turn-helix domain-containing protein [Acidaminobacter sp. JC074]|uniref:winged helix-turn-helix domain-containing protein n=1 Tax=Acidaminobacter sp. JC074 TaxID=2530199 RepID=UPI001F0EF466|nr:winged helix-turn-helix domain-containing protein [Acidaminobacter sp. JC074]